MYNPYNWTIEKEKKSEIESKCILDELAYISTELDISRLKQSRLKERLNKVNDEIIFLEEKKLYLIKKLAEHP